MTKYYVAVTYDVCEHNNLCESMNQYPLTSTADMDEQVKEFAKRDIAPLVSVYEVIAGGTSERTLCKEYTFEEYACHCVE